MKVARHDKGFIGKTEITEEGYLITSAIVTRTGVFTYRNGDGSTRKELRHPDEVFTPDSLESMKLKPITNDHPMDKIVTAQNVSELSIGNIGETIKINSPFVLAKLCIKNAEIIELIRNEEKQELSLGYMVDLVEEPGEFDGEEYTHRQTNIQYNHLALVERGRAGPMARIQLDNNDAEVIDMPDPMPSEGKREFIERCMQDSEAKEDFPEQEQRLAFCNSQYETQNDKELNMSNENILTLDGIDYKASPEVINAYKRVNQDLEDMKSKLDNKEKEYEELKADRDNLSQKLDEYKNYDFESEVKKAVENRVKLINDANKVVNDSEIDFSELSDLEIKKKVILSNYPSAKLDEASEVYIQARYDALFEDINNDGSENGAAQREKTTPKMDSSNANSAASARERMIQRQLNNTK